MYANAIYYRHVKTKIQKANNCSTDREERSRMITAEGGTSIISPVIVLIFLFITIIGILAAVALPAYETYTTKATLSEVTIFSQTAKQAVEDFAINKREWPKDATALDVNLNPSSKYISSVQIDKGVIYLHISKNAGTEGAIIYVPSVKDSVIVWSCKKSTVPAQYLPMECK